jgi:D-serine deaminase-like pyridoxal phosphate-dependent protein
MNRLTQGATRAADAMNLKGPTLVVDQRRARRNLQRMIDKARAAGVKFRPHFKTHQSTAVGQWFRDAGVTAITVSNLDMARRFADDGWRDITLAFPFNPRELDDARALAATIDLGLLVDSPAHLDLLADDAFRLWLKIDTGYGRSGVPWHDESMLRKFAGSVCGILTHSGHTYHAANPEQILSIHEQSLARMAAAKSVLGNILVSVGDTPSCTLADAFPGVDELRPGNFIFNDLMQLGVCAEADLAAGLLCPVVGTRPEQGQIVIHGGAVHVSKESLADGTYGICATLDADGFGALHRDARLVSISQEHGILEVGETAAREIGIGEMVLVMPVHSCLTCNLFAGRAVLL